VRSQFSCSNFPFKGRKYPSFLAPAHQLALYFSKYTS
jgi:hypothetical protein